MTTLTKTKTPAIKERIRVVNSSPDSLLYHDLLVCDSCMSKVPECAILPVELPAKRIYLCKSCINIAQIKFRFANEDNQRKTHR